MPDQVRHDGVRDGRAFNYRGDSQYQEVGLASAITGAFSGWEQATPSSGQVRALHAALDAARAVARQL